MSLITYLRPKQFPDSAFRRWPISVPTPPEQIASKGHPIKQARREEGCQQSLRDGSSITRIYEACGGRGINDRRNPMIKRRILTAKEISNSEEALKDVMDRHPRLSAKKREVLTEAVRNTIKGIPISKSAQHRKRKSRQKLRVTKSRKTTLVHGIPR